MRRMPGQHEAFDVHRKFIHTRSNWIRNVLLLFVSESVAEKKPLTVKGAMLSPANLAKMQPTTLFLHISIVVF